MAEDYSPERERHRGLYHRRESNMSEASFIGDVEMAQDEIFSGPMSESVPTASTSFFHRRSRANSTTSFAYYEEERDFDSEELPEDAL